MDNFIQKPKIISIEELPEYSDWPKRLLSLESFKIKYKTEKEVLREYQEENWGSLLKKIEGLMRGISMDRGEFIATEKNKVVADLFSRLRFNVAENDNIFLLETSAATVMTSFISAPTRD